MRVGRSAKLFGIAWLACGAWLGCNALLGNESAVFDPDAAAQLDATTKDGTPTTDGTTDGPTGTDGGLDVQVDAEGGPCPGIDLDASPTNCGACGHDCRGGACIGGRCQPVLLATDVEGPHALVLHDGYVYWVNDKSGDVLRVPVDGGAKQLLFDGPATTSGDSIAFAGSSFYYPLAILDGGIITCPKDGGCSGTPPYAVANLDVPSSVAISGNELYFVESQTSGRVGHCTLPCGGSFAEVTAPEGLLSHVAADDAGVYWSAILPTTGIRGKEGADAARAVASGAPVGDIVLTPGEVFWTERGNGPRAAPRDGGASRKIRVAPPAGLGTQSDNLYLTKDSVFFTEPPRGTIWQCPRSGCPDSGGAPVLTTDGTPYGIAADDGSIYWADEGTPDAGGAIFRLAR